MAAEAEVAKGGAGFEAVAGNGDEEEKVEKADEKEGADDEGAAEPTAAEAEADESFACSKAAPRAPPLTTMIMSRSPRSLVAPQRAWSTARSARARLVCTGETARGSMSTLSLGPA